MEPDDVIGPHPTTFDQIFLVVKGSGWIEGADGIRHEVNQESGAFIPLGENHSKGSKEGMVAIMVQATHFKLEQEP